MLGTLTRYLRFMGYDTASANDLAPGNAKEDTLLLERARQGGRILLTKDAEPARRGGEIAVLVRGEDVMDQVQQTDRPWSRGNAAEIVPVLSLQYEIAGSN